jgi:hypothetical protein
MKCALCASDKGAEFSAEMMLHFSGVEHLANPGMLICATVTVCLDCGFSGFTIPETELRALWNPSAAAAAA